MVNDRVETLRRDLAERLAAKFDVPLDLVLGDPGLSYASVEACMDIEHMPADFDEVAQVMNRVR